MELTHDQKQISHHFQGWQVDKSGITASSQEVSCLKAAWDFGFAKGQKAKELKQPSLIHKRETLFRALFPYRGPGPCSLHQFP